MRLTMLAVTLGAILALAALAAVRQSGAVSPSGGTYSALEEVDAAAFCAAVQAAAGVETNAMGAAWQPGDEQTASCWDMELDVR